jgi:hypothetical protein
MLQHKGRVYRLLLANWLLNAQVRNVCNSFVPRLRLTYQSQV